jgi:ribosomal-protein-alanine N-acetyltransferase
MGAIIKNTYEDNLVSERLLTRKLVDADHIVWAEFFEDEEATRFFTPQAFKTSLEWSKYWIEKQILRYQENRFGLQGLFDKRTNTLVGQCGLLLQEVDGVQELEVGYHILKKYWGQGYAPEAAKLFIEYARKNKLADRVVSIIHSKNFRSQRVAEKNGLARIKVTKFAGMDVYIYSTKF